MSTHAHTKPLSDQILFGIFLVVPFLALVAGLIPTWGVGADIVSLILLLTFFFVRTLGITVFFHRCFTHGSFKVRNTWLTYLGGIAGSMAVQGPLFQWVGQHIIHHQHADEDGDPHSPHVYGEGFWNITKGAVYAHIGWMFVNDTDHIRYTRRLREDPVLVKIDRWFPWCVVLGLILPPLVGVVLRQSVSWAVSDFVWGGLISLFFAHHVTWSVNSACHLWGKRPFATADHSTNNLLVALLTSGEGNHNGHHAFPKSAKHGLLGEPDLSWWVIQGLEKRGLVTDIWLPSPEQIANKLR